MQLNRLRPSGRLLPVIVALIVLNLAVVAIDRGQVKAEHWLYGNCWQPGVPRHCLAGYQQGKPFELRVQSYWASSSPIRPRAEPNIPHAKKVWGNAPGPQVFDQGVDPFVPGYIYEHPPYHSADPDFEALFHQNPPRAAAGMEPWRWTGSAYEWCESACTVARARIYLNSSWDAHCAGGLQTSAWQWMYAHEMGHVLGLDDHGSGSGNILMNNHWSVYCAPQSQARTPTVSDLGVLPPCSSPRGVRCAFNWATGFQKWVLNRSTPLGQTGGNFTFQSAEWNGDGVPDLYAIKMYGSSSGKTELHILSGGNNFQAPFLNQFVTGLHTTDPTQFAFALTDWNRAGKPDLIAIKKLGTSSNTTEVHIWSGESNYQTDILHQATQLEQTTTNFEFAAGDYNLDGVVDLYAIKKWETAGTTEIHPLSGAANFATFLDHRATAMGITSLNWTFDVRDYDPNGVQDIIGVRMNDPGLTRTEYHILSGSGSPPFMSFIDHVVSRLEPTNATDWGFAVTDWTLSADGAPDGKIIKKQNTGSGSTEVHILAGR
jgi:hypothetical protein